MEVVVSLLPLHWVFVGEEKPCFLFTALITIPQGLVGIQTLISGAEAASNKQ